MTKKILITGFEPFDSDTTNPSGDWISWMKDRPMPNDRETIGALLPVTFDGGFKAFKKVYDEFGPDIVILTGFAKNRKELSVERIGINWVDARIPDNDGVTITMQKIYSNGPDGLFTTIDVVKLTEIAEKAGGLLKLSTSAGEYVCNDLLYKVLFYLKENEKIKKAKATFIHIPLLDKYDSAYLVLESIVNDI